MENGLQVKLIKMEICEVNDGNREDIAIIFFDGVLVPMFESRTKSSIFF